MTKFPDRIEYSQKYQDNYYEYKHVHLPIEIFKLIKKNELLSEKEWKELGIQQSLGWVHYDIHKPEPNIILFRRPWGYNPETGLPLPNYNPSIWN